VIGQMMTVAQGISFRAYCLPVIFFILFAGATVPIDALAISPVRVIENEFIKDISVGWTSLVICEYRSLTEDRALFYGKVLNLKSTARGKVIESKDFVVRESDGSQGFHLGIAELEFPTVSVAQSVHKPNAPTQHVYFVGTKILTRYVSFQKGRRLLLVYSERHADAKVSGFFERLGRLRTRVWTG
jgi:hypothetical protein